MARTGRPKGAVTEMSKRIALRALGDENRQVALWQKFLNSKSEKIALQATIYLNDRAYGKPKEITEHSGPDGGPVELVVNFVSPAKKTQ